MTGIEKLREFVGGISPFTVVRGVTSTAYDMEHMEEAGTRLRNFLAAIADQIEREHAEDCEAIAWVREHGGLEEVEAHWSGRVPLKSVKWMIETHRAKRERLKAHALGLERKCAELGETIRELSDRAAKQSDEIRVMRDVIVETCARLGVEGTGSTVDDAQVIWREISRRLMPAGMEWPRYEDSGPVRIGDDVTKYVGGGTIKVRSVEFLENMTYLHERFKTDQIAIVRPGERVKRPAVLAADGEPIKVGEHVWDDHGEELVVLGLSGGLVRCRFNGETCIDSVDNDKWEPSQLTHQRPVLDADGVPIKMGDTVYLLPGEWCDEFPCLGFHGGEELEVFADGEADHVLDGVQCREKGTSHRYTCYPQPSQLTHTKPEIPDSWERIEEDAGCTATKYNERRGTIFTTKQQVARDLVRRCRALAERERGE